jgi:hypothetical protein
LLRAGRDGSVIEIAGATPWALRRDVPCCEMEDPPGLREHELMRASVGPLRWPWAIAMRRHPEPVRAIDFVQVCCGVLPSGTTGPARETANDVRSRGGAGGASGTDGGDFLVFRKNSCSMFAFCSCYRG